MAMNRESTAAAEKLSDEALSRQLGRCQRVEAIFMLLCIVSVIACVLVLWVWQKKLLACALLAVGAAGGLIAGAAQRQRRALLDASSAISTGRSWIAPSARRAVRRSFGSTKHGCASRGW